MEDPDRLKTLLETVISLGLCGELETHAKAYGAEHTTAYWCGVMETLIGFGAQRKDGQSRRKGERGGEGGGMGIAVASFVLAGVGVLYIGYTIGLLHGAVTAARELKKKDETVKLYESMIAHMTTMTASLLEKGTDHADK